MKLLSILFIVITASNLFGQFYCVNPDEYYDKFYFKENDVCYSISDYSSSFQSNDFDIEAESLMLNLIFTKNNFGRVFMDDIGLFIPYENDHYDRYKDHLIDSLGREDYYNLNLESLSIPASYIDTLYVVRNQEGGKIIEHKTKEPGLRRFEMVKVPIELMKFYILDSNKIDHSKYNVYTFNIDIEFKESDYISKKDPFVEIVCPEKINSLLIKKINVRLIEKGYLTDRSRKLYQGDVKKAVQRFQRDNDLNIGFIDQNTLDLLEVKLDN